VISISVFVIIVSWFSFLYDLAKLNYMKSVCVAVKHDTFVTKTVANWLVYMVSLCPENSVTSVMLMTIALDIEMYDLGLMQ
jgi:hypothetical protein